MAVESNRALLVVEVAAFLATAVFSVLWYFYPDGNWKQLVGLCGLFGSGAALYRRFPRRRTIANRFDSNAARVKHREELRKVLQEEIYRCRAEKLREDVIIRHVDRVDSYPDSNGKPGISPWFRVGLLDTYERGIVLCLRIGGLKKIANGYHYVDDVNGEKSDLTAWLMADVPYDSIVTVNIDGDKYYNYPHIYCYFDFDGEPYERKWFALREELPHGHPYFKQIATYEEVIKNNPTDGALFFA